MNAEEFGYALYRNRIRAGLSQVELAERMGTKQPAISRAERGRAIPTLEFLERWTKATGANLELHLGPKAMPDLGPRRPRPTLATLGRRKPRWDAWDRWELTRPAPKRGL